MVARLGHAGLHLGRGRRAVELPLDLAAAGVGTIGIVEFDRVDASNLHRQVLFGSSQVGRAKLAAGAARLRDLNPHITIEEHDCALARDNARQIVAAYDIVADGSDNFATRYLVSDACYLAKRPLVFAALGPFDGYLTTFKPYEKNAAGEPHPTYRCLFPEAPTGEAVFNCSEVGVLGAVAGVLAVGRFGSCEVPGRGAAVRRGGTLQGALGGLPIAFCEG